MARSLTDYVEFEGFRREVKAWFPVLKEMKLDFHIRAESAPNHSAWNEYVFIIADTAGIVDSEEDKYNISDNISTNNNNNRRVRTRSKLRSNPSDPALRPVALRPVALRPVAHIRSRERPRWLKNRIIVSCHFTPERVRRVYIRRFYF
ncbi:unnamed protein product [Lymnaea stagnalis]|uniref:Uncharacterized protein n=1 Tax=Lymnaea stagnalis TaxID=6523 RepID=A0AAV2H141_LYMST